MALRELLAERASTVCEQWLDAILADYGEETAALWRRVKDPFRNPVRHSFSTALPKLLASIVAGDDLGEDALAGLETIIKIRSIQDFSPSRAVGFVYALRDVLRRELAPVLADGACAAELSDLERRIERLALLAFDVYVRCRDQVFRLRQEELKRSVASLLRRWHGDELAEPAPEVVQLSPPRSHAVRR